MWKRVAQCARPACASIISSVSIARPAASNAVARCLHTSARVCDAKKPTTPSSSPAAAASSSSPSDSPDLFSDLDDLFGEEQAVSPTATGGATSRLTATLTDTRVTTQASAAAHAAASAKAQDTASLTATLGLLDPKNPPRLEPKHLKLLRIAVKDLHRKLERAEAQELIANPNVVPPTNPNIIQLQKRIAVCESLCTALFPPEIPSVPFDENATSDILDYAEAMPGVLNVMTPDHVDPMKLMAIDHKTTRSNRHLYCLFCKPSTANLPRNELVYTNVNLLTQFVNERGMVLQRAESRLCMIHQRKMARTIKQARNIGLMSPSSNWRIDSEFVYGVGAKDFNPHQTGAAPSTVKVSGVESNGMNFEEEPSSDRFDDQDFTGKKAGQ